VLWRKLPYHSSLFQRRKERKRWNVWRSFSEHRLGINHLDTAISLNNLAVCYLDQGKVAQAEPLLRRVLIIREQLLEANHLDLATSLNNLAAFSHKQRNYLKANSFISKFTIWK
jgi:tetratricopeptide (TPR) repeat protein